MIAFMLRVCIVGFGRIGREHSQWISRSGEAVVSCIVDKTTACRKVAESRGLITFLTLDEAATRAEFDAVLVSVPTAFHHEIALSALQLGKHVMIEKPMAVDFQQAQEIKARADELGKVVSVFQNRRWDEDFLVIEKAVKSGVLGRIFNVESRLSQWASCVGPAAVEFRPNWRNEKSFGGGGLFDWGSHFIDQMHLLLAPARPIRVFAQLRGNVWTSDADDFARILMDFDNGAAAMVEINTTTTRPLPRWHVDALMGSTDSPYSLEFDTAVWSHLLFTPADGSPQRMLERAEPGLSEIDIWRAFAGACAGDGVCAVELDSVMLTMRLLDAAIHSNQLGQAVTI